MTLLARRPDPACVPLNPRRSSLSRHPLKALITRVSFDSLTPLRTNGSLRPDLPLGSVCDRVYASILRNVDTSTCLHRGVRTRPRQRGHVNEAWRTRSIVIHPHPKRGDIAFLQTTERLA